MHRPDKREPQEGKSSPSCGGIGTLLLVVLHINELLRFLDDLRLQIGGQRLIAGEFKYKAAASLRELAQIGGEIMHLTDRHVGFQRLLTILGRMHARVVTEDELSTDHISVGSHVRIKDEDGDEDEYDITGSTEADPVNGKISDESPIGAALIGHSVGDKVDITLPSGAVVQYEVMEIGRAEL